MASRRLQQLGDQMRAELSDLLLREVRDPRIGFVTITRVGVTPDLRYARVNVSCYGDEPTQQETLRALKRAAGFLRTALAQRVRVRHMPELQFHLDHSMEYAEEVQRTLQSLASELASPPASEPATAGASDDAPGQRGGRDDNGVDDRL